MLILCLNFLGLHAQKILPLGIVIALFLPGSGDRLQFIVPWVIGLIYAVAFMRIDIKPVIIRAFSTRQIVWNIAVSTLILIAIPLLLISICLMAGLDARYVPSAVWYAVAPPIASTAWMCGLLGLNMAAAMEIIVLTSLLAPFTGPFLASLFLGGAVPVSSMQMLADLALMIFGGIVAAQIWQKLAGKAWIRRHDTALSGLSALGMLLFLIPVFNGVLTRILDMPELALHLVILAIALNFSTQAVFLLLSHLSARKNIADITAVLAIVTGNRNVGLYYGALPPDPVFGLFTALYQIPLYLTPLVTGMLRRN